ncbi:hypothetical protein MRX96_051284 [Rhipicephalus microplus]
MAPSSGRDPSNGAVCNGSSRRRWERVGRIVTVFVVLRAVAVTGVHVPLLLPVIRKDGEKTGRTSLGRRATTPGLDPRRLGLELGRYRRAGPEQP